MTSAGRAFRFNRRSVQVSMLVLACAGLIGLGVTAADDGMSYYRTPAELTGTTHAGDTVRLGGLVVEDSMHEDVEVSTLTVTDGAVDVTVRYPGRFPDVVQEGQGAVIEGVLAPDGSVVAHEIILRHSNEYSAPTELEGS